MSNEVKERVITMLSSLASGRASVRSQASESGEGEVQVTPRVGTLYSRDSSVAARTVSEVVPARETKTACRLAASSDAAPGKSKISEAGIARARNPVIGAHELAAAVAR